MARFLLKDGYRRKFYNAATYDDAVTWATSNFNDDGNVQVIEIPGPGLGTPSTAEKNKLRQQFVAQLKTDIFNWLQPQLEGKWGFGQSDVKQPQVMAALPIVSALLDAGNIADAIVTLRTAVRNDELSYNGPGFIISDTEFINTFYPKVAFYFAEQDITWSGTGDIITQVGNEWVTKTVEISNAEALDCYDNPIEILPTPPAGLYYEYDGVIEYLYGSAPFTDGYFGVGSSDGDFFHGLTDSDFMLNHDTTAFLPFTNRYTSNTKMFTTGKGLYFINNPNIAIANPTDGDGTFIVKIKYKIGFIGA